MKSIRKAIFFGFFVWLIPFVVSILIFPLHENERALFESIMPVAGGVTLVIFAYLYFKKVEVNFLKEGLLLGAIFFAISIGLDLLMFMQGPMKMAFIEYVKDIGVTYLLMPVITVGMGLLLEKKMSG